MAQNKKNVKKCAEKFAEWIDCHPRTGWYLAVWVGLITLNTLLDLYSKLSHWLG